MTDTQQSHRTQNILTLIAPFSGGLKDSIIKKATDILNKAGAVTGDADWLSDAEACDIPFQGFAPETVELLVEDAFKSEPLDLCAQVASGRRKRLLIADMDSTIVTSETLDELAEYAGLKEQISAITTHAMNGEILFRDAFNMRVSMLRDLDVTYLEKTLAQIEITAGAETLIATMKSNGAYTALASGGFRYFTSRVGKQLGFDFNIGNEIGIKNGKLTGTVLGEIVTKAKKKEVLEGLVVRQGITLSETIAVGDGANDLPMLKAAGMGVAYHAKPVVVAEARTRVNHADLTALLYFQGYRRQDFVTG